LAEPIIDNYSIFVNILTITLAILAIAIAGGFFGVYQSLRYKLENEIRDKVKSEMQIEKARFYISHGYMFWIDYQVSDSPPNVKIDYLKQAIKETEKGLGLIKDSKQNDVNNYYQKELVKCVGRNNLAYYYYELVQLRAQQAGVLQVDVPEGAAELAEEYAKYVYEKILLFPENKGSWTDTYKKVVLKEEG